MRRGGRGVPGPRFGRNSQIISGKEPSPPEIVSPGNQHNSNGDTVSLAITATNTTTYEATGLPPSLSINAATGLITGTLTAVVTKSVTIIVHGPGGEASTSFEWFVAAVKPIEPETEAAIPRRLKVGIPHFSAQFTIGREGAIVVEQDTSTDVAACVYRIAACPIGYREDQPSFGIPELAWNNAPLKLAPAEAAIEFWEPRATLESNEESEALELASRIVTMEVE